MDFTIIKNNLIKNGFEVSAFENSKDAVNYIDSKVDGMSIGFGGSVTIEQIGLMGLLEKHNKVLYRFNNEGKSPDDVMKEQLTCDIYFLSVNGISETGEIINIDGRSNRIAASLYGHKKVYFIIGKNKIEETMDKALYRARNVAAPKNAQRLNKKTPCAINGNKCFDCNSPDRICRDFNILVKKPTGCDFEIVLINEDLGY